MQREEFYNFEKWQDKYYRTPTGGEFNQTHVFTISSSNGRKPTIMVKQDIHGAIERIDDLIPNNRSCKARVLPPQERAIALKNMKHDLEVLPNSGIKPIKQVELYQKWGPLLPKEAREITCPRPSDEIINKVKGDKTKKGKRNLRVWITIANRQEKCARFEGVFNAY